MPLNKDKILRYSVLDKCFQDTANYYNMNRLHQAVNREVMRVYDKTVSIRTIQEDVKILQFSPYNVVFDDDLREQRYYRYADPDFKLNIVQSLSKSEQSAIRDTIKLLRPKVGDFEKATPLHYYMYLCLQNIAADQRLSGVRLHRAHCGADRSAGRSRRLGCVYGIGGTLFPSMPVKGDTFLHALPGVYAHSSEPAAGCARRRFPPGDPPADTRH